MRISEGQKDKLNKAFESNSKSITIRLMLSDLYGEDVIAFTNPQADRLVEAYVKKERHDKKNVKNAISPQENRRICTSVNRIDPISNWNCLARIRL